MHDDKAGKVKVTYRVYNLDALSLSLYSLIIEAFKQIINK